MFKTHLNVFMNVWRVPNQHKKIEEKISSQIFIKTPMRHLADVSAGDRRRCRPVD